MGVVYTLRIKQKSNKKLKELNSKLSSSLERNRNLVKEIHHRVKNNLQVVSSLLNLQGRFEKDTNVQKAIKSGKDRVHSISLLHKRLYQNEDLSQLDTKAYFTELIHHIIDTFRGKEDLLKVDIEIDNIDLDIDTVVPLGLIANELITNSMKYAFNNNSDPALKFSLKRLNDDQYQMHIKDNGPGLPFTKIPKSPKSMGMQLIKSFTQRMEAEIDINNEEGSEITISFDYISSTAK